MSGSRICGDITPMLRFTTAGESHGPALVSVLEGIPAGSWIVQVETPDGQRWQGAATTAGAPEAAVTVE